ncbi:DUF429 domain-containing protein [Runella sp. MFBS21]|uniref:DUF429 domain-containing protein n=1 Tax=Runella sp. MFBS21 TaxID=3034018 RepID=UPI0023F6ABBC|nr:DUF429 domain-containing protein [Runella sp. MFBS21]MDF7817884.1 DUF429 domain-containing protein [Runella sp. MFBS21]
MDIRTFAGIDYGAKTSGNTVICYHNGQSLLFFDALKKDADSFIFEWMHQNPWVSNLFLDAPLSLPAVYFQREGFINYHYRHCDLALKAMSPLFLGGLTARAMELTQKLRSVLNIQTYEVYPKALAQLWLGNSYHKKLSVVEMTQLGKILIQKHPSLHLAQSPHNQHQFDALLAWLSGYRFMSNQHLTFGKAEEGLIIV